MAKSSRLKVLIFLGVLVAGFVSLGLGTVEDDFVCDTCGGGGTTDPGEEPFKDQDGDPSDGLVDDEYCQHQGGPYDCKACDGTESGSGTGTCQVTCQETGDCPPPANTKCEENPGAPGCTESFCEENPDATRCTGIDICEDYPSYPGCGDGEGPISNEADFDASLVSVSPRPVPAGDNMQVDYLVRNNGSQEGSTTVDLQVDGTQVQTQNTGTIQVNEGTQNQFDWSSDPGLRGNKQVSVCVSSGCDSSTVEFVEPAFFALTLTEPVIE